MLYHSRREIPCPLCTGETVYLGTHHWDDRFRCVECGCIFELDPDFIEGDEPIFFSPQRTIMDCGRSDPCQEVVNWLLFHHPEWSSLLNDGRFLRFLINFERYNHWLNHGNEPSMQESIEDGDYEDMVRCILGESDSLDEYFGHQHENMAPGETDGYLDRLENEFVDLRAVYEAGRGF